MTALTSSVLSAITTASGGRGASCVRNEASYAYVRSSAGASSTRLVLTMPRRSTAMLTDFPGGGPSGGLSPRHGRANARTAWRHLFQVGLEPHRRLPPVGSAGDEASLGGAVAVSRSSARWTTLTRLWRSERPAR